MCLACLACLVLTDEEPQRYFAETTSLRAKMWEKVGMRWGPALTPVGCATHHWAGIVLLATCCLLLRVLSPNSVCPLSFSLRLRAASCVSAGSPPASAAPPSPTRPLTK